MEAKVPRLIKVISYSSFADFRHCPWFFKLTRVDDHKTFEKNTYAYWGDIIHDGVQDVLLGTKTEQEALERVERTWKKFCGIFKLDEKTKKWSIPAKLIFKNLREVFSDELGEFEVLAVEERLEVSTEDFPQKFKGFIDVVLKMKDGRVIIIDLKTCDTSFKFNKFRNKIKDYQLTFYKVYYAKKHGVNLRDIETYFVTLERSERSKKPLQFIKVTSGPKKVENAMKLLGSTLKSVNKNRYLKNRVSCHKFSKPGLDEKNTCVFYGTEYCPK